MNMYVILAEVIILFILLFTLFFCFIHKKLEYKSLLDNNPCDKNLNYLLLRYGSFKEISDEDRCIFYQLILNCIYEGENIFLEDYLKAKEDKALLEEYFYDIINDYYKRIYIVEDEDDVYYYAKSRIKSSSESFKIVKMNNYQMELLFRRYKRFNIIDFTVFVTEENRSQYYNLKESELQLEDIH